MRSPARSLNPLARGLLIRPTCELAPTPPVRRNAQAKYSKRFRAAYGQHCSPAGALRRSSSPKSPAARTNRLSDAGLPVTVTSRAYPNPRYHHTIHSFPMDDPPKPNCAVRRHERRQSEPSRCHLPVVFSTMYAMPTRNRDSADAMITCNRQHSLHGRARLRTRPADTAAESLTAPRPHQQLLRASAASPMPHLPPFACQPNNALVPLTGFIADILPRDTAMPSITHVYKELRCTHYGPTTVPKLPKEMKP